MGIERGHRKSLSHYEATPCFHELTFSCYRRLPLLIKPAHCELLAESLDRARLSQGWRLLGYVFMPEHVHLLVYPGEDAKPVSGLLSATKRPQSWWVKQRLAAAGDPLLERLTVQERSGKMTFRFWQVGAGYDRNLWTEEVVRRSLDYLHANPVRRGLCETPGQWWWSSWHFHEGPSGPALPHVDGWPEE